MKSLYTLLLSAGLAICVATTAARSQAILDATQGRAKADEVYAAVLRSEWRVALDWRPRRS